MFQFGLRTAKGRHSAAYVEWLCGCWMMTGVLEGRPRRIGVVAWEGCDNRTHLAHLRRKPTLCPPPRWLTHG